MILDTYTPKNKKGAILRLITKTTDTLIEQTKAKQQETLDH